MDTGWKSMYLSLSRGDVIKVDTRTGTYVERVTSRIETCSSPLMEKVRERVKPCSRENSSPTLKRPVLDALMMNVQRLRSHQANLESDGLLFFSTSATIF